MRQGLSMLVLLSAVVLAAGSCERAETQRGPQTATVPKTDPAGPSGEEPLLLEDEPLLLLENEPDSEQPAATGADNSRCFVCHINYKNEELAAVHAQAGIGCAQCHGESDEHIADESWASGGNGTAPDIMYPKDKINPACMACHPKDKIDREPHKLVFTDDGEKNYCTDCHGEHRLTSRRCKWK